MPKPPPDPKSAFKQYQTRRAADGFESAGGPTVGAAWSSFVGERGQRLKSLLASFDLVHNEKYLPSGEASIQLVRDVLARWGVSIPGLPAVRLAEWFGSPQGGRTMGWREVPSGLAQTAANDGRPAVVLGVSPEVAHLAAVVYPDVASNAANPTVLMVTDQFALDPGTVLQGFRGQPVRFFAHGQ